MSDIHHLLCTHCTFGSSALEHGHSAEAASRVLGYSVRASSINDRGSLRAEFRAVERLLSYDLPPDATAESKKQLDATTAPVRLCFMPELSGRQVVGQVVFRQFDTAGRPGSYFAHLLVTPSTSPLAVLNCLRLWGRKDEAGLDGWCSVDREAGFQSLRPLPALEVWHGEQRAEHWDELARCFLKQGAAPISWSGDILIPSRWSDAISEAARTDLVKSVLQALLDKHSVPTVVLAVEPAVATIVFYAALRLLPESLRTGVGFSTYEQDPSRASYRLVATTFATDAGDFKPQLYQSESFVCNSYQGFQTGSFKPAPGKYANWAVRMLAEDKLARVDTLCTTIEKAWTAASEAFTPADLEVIRNLEDYLNRLFRGEFRAVPAQLPKPHRLFLAKRCSSVVRSQHAQLNQLATSDSAMLIRTLIDIIKPFPEEWRMLESTPEVARWIRGGLPTDEQGVLAYLAKPPSTFSDDDAAALLLGYVAEHGSLPKATRQSVRLWGAIATGQSPAGYAAPALLVRLLGQVEVGSLNRILAPPHTGLDVIKGVAKAIGNRLEQMTSGGPDGPEARRLIAHLRCLFDNAAADLNPKDFEALLRNTQELCSFYNPEPGDFGNRITAFVTSLRTRPAEVCVDADLIKLACTWAQCSPDHPVLHAQLNSWKKLLAWFSLFEHRSGSKIPFAGYWKPAREGVYGEICLIVRDIVPDGDLAANTLRQTLLKTILSTYREKGWLPHPGKGLLGIGTKKDALLETIEFLCKQPLR